VPDLKLFFQFNCTSVNSGALIDLLLCLLYFLENNHTMILIMIFAAIL